MRIALAGGFAFPVPQGSQLYARDQALALRAAGAEVTLFCYGPGPPPPGVGLVRLPRALAPRRTRSGPALAKPLADAGLALALARRAADFDVVLAHNAEAGLTALAARARPVIYVAHTLLELELPSYAHARLRAPLARLGRTLDRTLARRCDGVLALSETAAKRLGAWARGPVAVIPPGRDADPPHDPREVAAACARHALVPGGFALYAGNLDGYQELAELALAARLLAPFPVVAATHADPRLAPAPLRGVRLESARHARLLCHGAALAVLPRRIPGGFPIKLLNYMEAARAIVAHAEVAGDLEHGREALLLAPGTGAAELADAIGALARDPDRARRLGLAARAALETRFAWPRLAERTLELCSGVRGHGRIR